MFSVSSSWPVDHSVQYRTYATLYDAWCANGRWFFFHFFHSTCGEAIWKMIFKKPLSGAFPLESRVIRLLIQCDRVSFIRQNAVFQLHRLFAPVILTQLRPPPLVDNKICFQININFITYVVRTSNINDRPFHTLTLTFSCSHTKCSTFSFSPIIDCCKFNETK